MEEKDITFGKIVLEARKKKGLNLRDCSALIFKEDGLPISFQYLNDLEKNRRNPPSENIIKQISSILDIPLEVLYFYAGILPNGIDKNADQSRIIAAYKSFAQILSKKTSA